MDRFDYKLHFHAYLTLPTLRVRGGRRQGTVGVIPDVILADSLQFGAISFF